MKRKSFILLIALLLISISTICFADDMANDVKNGMNGATNTVVDGASNLAEDVRSGIGNAENTIENGVRNIGSAITDGAENMGNAVMGGMDNMGDNFDNDYTTTRTAAEDVSVIDNTVANTWTWIALAIAATVIVGLVWYYASERSHKH